MNGLESIYDECLEYEQAMLADLDFIERKRTTSYKNGEREKFKRIIPLLDSIICEAEKYKEFLEQL